MADSFKESSLIYHTDPTPGKLAITPTKPLANKRDLSLAYSPGVAYACELIEQDPTKAANVTAKGNLVGVITNGTAVLGLGNIGPLAGKPVMEGKAVLFKKFANIDVFDIEVNETDVDKLVDIIASLEPTFGAINLEDIKAPECFLVEQKLRERMNIPVFHDDQHGTAIVAAAAVYNGLQIVDKSLGEVKEKIIGKGYTLYNHYGPTENTIDALCSRCSGGTVVLGGPISNARCYILDNRLELLPIGVPGELCIAGVGLARGYLNQPELTAERFCLDLYRSYKSYRTYLYRTGDLARWLPDGNIEFLGRIDQQVQINGIRIELGEIESALLKHKDIKEAVVIPRTNEKNEPYLCAFVKAAGDLGQSNFKESLVRELPLYMIPEGFVELEKIPLTPTGKVNRKLLESIAIEDKKQEVKCKYAAPKTEIEIKIAAIWKEVLNTTKVGIHDNFFDIGGNSLGIIQVIFKLKEILKRDIPALIMFEYPTIASIIQYLEKNPEDSTAPGQDYEKKDRREKTGRGQNKMRQRRGKLKQIRIE